MSFKTFLLTCCVFAVFSACEQSDMLDDVTPNENHGQYDESKCYDFNVDMKTAAYAAGFLDSTSIVNIEPITFDSDTIMYAVNYVEGWKLFSADMRVTPVLVSSPTGSFNYESQITGSKLWIQNIASNLIELRKNKSGVSYDELVKNQDYQFWKQMYLCAYAEKVCSATDSVKNSSRRKAIRSSYTIRKYLCKRLLHTQIVENKTGLLNKRMETKWHQENPYNKYVPLVINERGTEEFAAVGCTAVAMGQLLYWAHYNLGVPLGLYHGAKYAGTYPINHVFYPGVYHPNSDRWDYMFKTDTEQRDYFNYYVAEFLAELGYKLNMDYGLQSAALPQVSVMNEYGLTWDEGDYEPNIVVNNLKKGLPVLITAFSNLTKKGGQKYFDDGHAWIIDGLKEQTTTTTSEYVWEIAEAIESNDLRIGEPHMSRPLPPTEHHLITSEDDGLRLEEPEVWENLDIYNSYSELCSSYLEVKDYDYAINQGLFPGKREYNNSTKVKYFFMMNWGENQLRPQNRSDELEYSADMFKWEDSNHNVYKYNPIIYYNIRKK